MARPAVPDAVGIDWNTTKVQDMSSMFDGSGLSTANYSQALKGWAGQTVRDGVTLGATGKTYSCAAAVARQSLIDDHNWSITDAGLAPCVSISPDPVAYDPLKVNETVSKTVTVSSPGGMDLILPADALTVSGSNAGQFSLSADNCSTATLPPAGSCTVTLTFAPSSTGDKTAILGIASNATSSPDSVALSGTGTQPALSASPSQLTFSEQLVNTTGGSQTATVTNTGTATLTVSGTTLTGAGFALAADSCTNAALPAGGGTCTVQVNFTPTAEGVVTGQLSFSSNAPGSPHMVPWG